MSARRKLAVALLLEGDLATEVEGLQRGLGGDRERIVPHVTLVPPIDVREDDVPAALAVLRSAAATVEPFDLVLGPVTTFLPKNPVVQLAVDGDLEVLRALHAALHAPPIDRPDTHDFVPHVTLALGLSAERTEAAITALADFEALFPVRSVVLLEHRAPGTHVWNPVAEARLGRRF